METEIKPKRSVKCTLLFIFIILVSLGVIGYLGYLLYDANNTLNDCKDASVVPPQKDNDTDSNEENTVYKKYLEGISKKDTYEISFFSSTGGGRYTFFLTKDNEVFISGIDSDDNTEEYVTVPGTENTIDESRAKKTDFKDVAKIYVTTQGNAGYQYVYFLMTNGELHKLDTTSMNKTEKLDLDNIMYITVEYDRGGTAAYAVDIDGNSYNLSKYE